MFSAAVLYEWVNRVHIYRSTSISSGLIVYGTPAHLYFMCRSKCTLYNYYYFHIGSIVRTYQLWSSKCLVNTDSIKSFFILMKEHWIIYKKSILYFPITKDRLKNIWINAFSRWLLTHTPLARTQGYSGNRTPVIWKYKYYCSLVLWRQFVLPIDWSTFLVGFYISM